LFADPEGCAMRVDVIDDFESLCELRGQWEAVYDADPEAQLFLSWMWMSKWLGDVITPWIVLAARPDGDGQDHVAFFPLRIHTRIRKGGGFFTEIQVACQETADYTGFICRPECEDEAIPALAKFLAAMHWATLDLRYFSASDTRLNLFLDEFSARTFKIKVPERDPESTGVDYRVSLYVDLPESWDTYLGEKLSAKTRQRVRNFLRKVEDADRFRITYAEQDTIERDLDILARFWALKWGDQLGKNLAHVQTTDRTMLRHCFDEGVLFMPVLWEGERPLGAVAILVDRRHKTYLFKLFGRDETFQNPSPGVILIAHAIRRAIREGFQKCDFLQGNHAYKYAFGVDEFRLKHCAVIRIRARNLMDCLDKRWLDQASSLADNLIIIGRIDEAELGYRQILKVDPRHRGARQALADVLTRKGHHAAAKRLLDTLVAVEAGEAAGRNGAKRTSKGPGSRHRD
jgi:CelD/BcsL family acetyltransferase involved in cellulose biosynthesis